MVYIPRKVQRGKHYALYTEALKKGKKVKTKAALLKEALRKAEELEEHTPEIDFIPANFTLQVHGWFLFDKEKGYTSLDQIKKHLNQLLKERGNNLNKHVIDGLKGKWHWDLRIKKKTAPTWIGFTAFKDVWKGRPERKVLGTAKGYQILLPEGKKLQAFLAERAEEMQAKDGGKERKDRIEWMKVKAQWFDPFSPGNPTKKEHAAMLAVEFYKPACLHRRDLDFVDCTFFGKYLKGRYFIRLVSRKLKMNELMEWQKEAIRKGKAKAFFDTSFYYWKAKTQWGQSGTPYTMDQVRKAALGKIALDPVPAPPRKK